MEQEWSHSLLEERTLRDLLGELISGLAKSERNLYLESHPGDKGNGSYDRDLAVGSMPLDIAVPRVRSGDFRSLILPEKYQRGYPEEIRNILLGLLISSRSISSAKQALKQLGLPFSEKELEAVAGDVLQDFDLRHTRPIESDMIALLLDGKYLEIRDGNQLKPLPSTSSSDSTGRDTRGSLLAFPKRGGKALKIGKRF